VHVLEEMTNLERGERKRENGKRSWSVGLGANSSMLQAPFPVSLFPGK